MQLCNDNTEVRYRSNRYVIQIKRYTGLYEYLNSTGAWIIDRELANVYDGDTGKQRIDALGAIYEFGSIVTLDELVLDYAEEAKLSEELNEMIYI